MENKKKILYKDIEKIKKAYFRNIPINSIAKKLWYNLHIMRVYCNWRATSIYINANWIHKRCTNCKIHRHEKFFSHTKRWLFSICKICDTRRAKNRLIYLKNIWKLDSEKLRESWRKSWENRKHIYNLKRKIIRKIKIILWKQSI